MEVWQQAQKLGHRNLEEANRSEKHGRGTFTSPWRSGEAADGKSISPSAGSAFEPLTGSIVRFPDFLHLFATFLFLGLISEPSCCKSASYPNNIS